MSGLDPRQLLELAVRPALKILGEEDFGGLEAEQLLIGTAAVESGLVFLKQLGQGPALGLWQMEPFTHDDIFRRADIGVSYALRNQLSVMGDGDAGELAWNLRYAAAMCRLKYRDARPDLPGAWDVDGMAMYHKKFYNSVLGATKPGEFRSAWNRLIQPQAERMWPQ